jgi:hypothetical protein
VTIERGVDWGRPAPLPAGAPLARTDRELAALLGAGRSEGPDGPRVPEVGLLGGDLWRTLGGSSRPDGGRAVGADPVRLPIDAVRVRLDGVEHRFVAHLVARGRGWHGRFLLVMNAEWLGEWKVAPRAHPDDGLLDVLDGSLPLRQRLQARRRAPVGDHLPHPGIRTSRVRSLTATFEPARHVWLDGWSAGRCHTLELTVEPDSLAVYV